VTQIRVDSELWAANLLPQGTIEKWLKVDGAFVEAGEALAAVRIEGSLHELISPVEGWLTIDCNADSIIAPGAVIGHIGD
jgi:pyruvate/2-oxoglutarate dehydrogenase complex dihydrolipoamide acyltransferase (E2) component